METPREESQEKYRAPRVPLLNSEHPSGTAYLTENRSCQKARFSAFSRKARRNFPKGKLKFLWVLHSATRPK